MIEGLKQRAKKIELEAKQRQVEFIRQSTGLKGSIAIQCKEMAPPLSHR